MKPHASIFEAALAALGVAAAEAVMVGDSSEDDIEGARALGMRAMLLDRDGRSIRTSPSESPTSASCPPRSDSAVGAELSRRARPRQAAVWAPSGTSRGRDAATAELGRGLRAGGDGADADVLAVEELEPLRERPRRERSPSSSAARASWSPSYCRWARSGRPMSSQSRAKNFGSRAATVRWRPSAVG